MPTETANALLLAPNYCTRNNLLSPNSASSRNSPNRRRNSYAAPLTENAVAAITASESRNSLETTKNNLLHSNNGSRQSLVSIDELDSNMLMPVYASGISSSGAQFLDPSNAGSSSNASWRRRLPPTPAMAGVVNNNNNNCIQIRRGSSPRVLPTPPPQLPLNSCGQQQPSPLSPDATSPADMILERRPSTGRRLPPEPVGIQTTIQIPSTNNSSPLLSPIRIHGIISPLADEVVNQLHRSVSTKHSKSTVNKLADLPPAPPISIITTSYSNSPPPTINDSQRLIRTTSASASDSTPSIPIQLTERAAANPIITNKSKNVSTNPCNPINPVDVLLSPPRSANHSQQSQQSTTSAPQTPRFFEAAAARFDDRESMSAIGIGYVPQRKFSDQFEPTAAISSICLARNGSMAHLLEQQHLLRQEFMATPDSAITVNTNATTATTTHSNSSSLSPSIEQLNYMPNNNNNCGGSKLGSDIEDNTSTSAINTAVDARIHGINPSLYGANAANSASAYAFQPPNNDNASMPTTAPTTTTGSSNSSTAAISASCSWSTTVNSQHALNGSSSVDSGTVCTDFTAQKNSNRPRGLGLIHCSLQFFPIRKRLRVSVLKIEGLAGDLRPELEILPFCRVHLTPSGKTKPQLSVVKRGRNAVFNQEFFFDSLSSEELDGKSLSVEVFHQSTQKLQKDLEIGEIFVPLKDLHQLHTKREVRIIEELKCSVNTKKLGKLYITSCIEKEARRLTINLIKVDDLPKWGIIGAPDVCIRITLSQGNGPAQTKSSRVLKSTTNAVYKEAVMFLISTSQKDLQQTKITISVHDLSRSVTGADVIGYSYLGELAMDKSEIEQWKNTMEHWGKEYKGSHHLKSPKSQAPDVIISEAQSDGETNAD